MKHILGIFILICMPLVISAQSDATYRAYINRYAAWAQETESYGVPAYITLAQGLLESGAGTSRLAREANNHFGIKVYPDWGKRPFCRAWDDEKRPSKFCKYNSVKESFIDHAKFLRRYHRYDVLFTYDPRDYRKWAWGLQNKGYATSKTYAVALIGLIEKYQLYRYSNGTRLPPSASAEPIYITTQKHIPVKRMKEQWVVVDRFVEVEEEVEIIEDSISEENLVDLMMKIYEVYDRNDVRCTVLHLGESLEMVARREDVSINDLLRMNELQEVDTTYLKEHFDDFLPAGSIIYLDKKQPKYKGGDVDFAITKKDDTLYSISQRYGVKAKSLAKFNKEVYGKYGIYKAIPEDVTIWLK